MSNIEELLADAYRSAAETVAPGSLRPLGEPGAIISPESNAVGARRRHRSRARLRRIVPLAAAIAMVCVAVAVAIASNSGPDSGRWPTGPARLPGGTPVPLPRYFIGMYGDPGNDLLSDLGVYDAATGALVTDLASRTQGLTFTAVAATASGTEFLAAAEPVSGGGIGCGATLYVVKLTRAGRLASLSALAGAPHPGYIPVSGLQVSADGSTVAVVSGPCYVPGQGSWPDRVDLLSLANGRVRRWTPGGPTVMPALGSLSADGHSLAFSNPAGTGSYRGANDGGARIVGASAKNGSLATAARVVVPGTGSPAHGVESVALSPDGTVLYACERRAATAAGYHYTAVLAAYHAANGHLIRVLRSWNSDQFPCQLAMAPSGHYALVTGLFTAPAAYAYRVNLSTGQAVPVGRALVPGRPPGNKDPYQIAW